MTNLIEQRNKEFEEKFVKTATNHGEFLGKYIEPNKTEEIISFHTHSMKLVLEEAIDKIKNGGFSTTVLTIQHNGETFINERQLIEGLLDSIK